MTLCSIVIRSFNEADHIGRLFEGISKQSISDVEIILVDSGSTDSTLEIASNYPVKIIRIEPTDFTFGRSLNKGISHTNSNLIVIASAHVYPVYPDWLEQLLTPFSEKEIALSYGKQRGDRNSNFAEQQIFKQWYPNESLKHQPHPFCNNANSAIRKELWEKRPFDETLTGLEDLEWAKWITDQGYFVSYKCEAEVIHVHNETPIAVYNRYKREAIAFKRIFPEENFSFNNFITLASTNIANDIKHLPKNTSIFSNLVNLIWFRLMQFWGTFQGYRFSGPVSWQLRKTFYYPGKSLHHPDSLRTIDPIQYGE